MREKPQSGSILRVVMFASLVMLLFLCSSVCLGARMANDDGSQGGGGRGTIGQGDILYGDPDMPQGKGTGAENPLNGPSSRGLRTSSRGASIQARGEDSGRRQLVSAQLDARLMFRFCLFYLVQR